MGKKLPDSTGSQNSIAIHYRNSGGENVDFIDIVEGIPFRVLGK